MNVSVPALPDDSFEVTPVDPAGPVHAIASALEIAFQPIVDIRTQRVVSYEALVRGLDNESAGTLLASIPDADLHAFDVEARRKAIALAADPVSAAKTLVAAVEG